MFDPELVLIGQVADKLEADFRSAYDGAPPRYAETLGSIARSTLERIAGCNALYHNLHHTILVTVVGIDVLKGKLALGAELPPEQWLDFAVSLLCHDIGYVPHLLSLDRNGALASGTGDETFTLPVEKTDASLAPFHVDRSMRFVEEQFAAHPFLDCAAIMANIDRTRFPVPSEKEYQSIDDAPGLLRAADLLGQVSDPRGTRRYSALFYEFEETGLNSGLGFASPHDLVRDFPRFYSKVVARYCSEAMRLLDATADGRAWLGNLRSQLTAVESEDRALIGP